MLANTASEEPLISTRLTEPQAAVLATLLIGAQFAVVETAATDDLTESSLGVTVDTLEVAQGSSIVGVLPEEALSPLNAEVALLGVICDQTPELIESDPARPLQVGDRLVVAARVADLLRLRAIL